jgi:hypothetical protein
MRMPVYLENNNRDGRALDEVSDAVDDGEPLLHGSIVRLPSNSNLF